MSWVSRFTLWNKISNVIPVLIVLIQSEFILDPGIDIRTFETGLQVPLTTELTCTQFAIPWVVACDQIGIDFLLTLPWVKVIQLWKGSRWTHPFDRLVVCHEIDVRFLQQLVNESKEDTEILLLFEPYGVEIDAEWCFVALVVTIEIVHEHVKDFVIRQMSRTWVNHSTCVSLNVQWIHDHLPHPRERARGTLLSWSGTPVWNPVVQCVWPERRIGFGCNHTAVVQESELLHHDELCVPSNSQEGNSHSSQLVQRNTSEFIDDVSHACKLVEPVLECCVERPPQLRLSVTAEVTCLYTWTNHSIKLLTWSSEQLSHVHRSTASVHPCSSCTRETGKRFLWSDIRWRLFGFPKRPSGKFPSFHCWQHHQRSKWSFAVFHQVSSLQGSVSRLRNRSSLEEYSFEDRTVLEHLDPVLDRSTTRLIHQHSLLDRHKTGLCSSICDQHMPVVLPDK